jgi:hypothetical protein
VTFVELFVRAPGAFRDQAVWRLADNLVDEEKRRTMRNEIGNLNHEK